jgi:hypothetical protein
MVSGELRNSSLTIFLFGQYTGVPALTQGKVFCKAFNFCHPVFNAPE